MRHSKRRTRLLSRMPCLATHRRLEPKRWIAYQKRKWKARAAQRKKRRLEAAKARDGDQPAAQRPRAGFDLPQQAMPLLMVHIHALTVPPSGGTGLRAAMLHLP